MSMSDELAPSHHEGAAAPAYPESSAATAGVLSAVGYGLFAWLQPGGLESIHPMRTVTDLVRAESAPGDSSRTAGPEAASGTDTLIDEDLAAAQLLASLTPAEPDDPERAEPRVAEVHASDEVASYSTPRDTIAMLEEIAFLDE